MAATVNGTPCQLPSDSADLGTTSLSHSYLGIALTRTRVHPTPTLTPGGTKGSVTFVNGVVTAYTPGT